MPDSPKSAEPSNFALETRGLTKHFGDVCALDGVDLTVPRGTVLALLGPNGAGKTTTIRILTTLLTADSGSATVAGCDVATNPRGVRERIGLTGQETAVDELLTARENLRMIGALAHLDRSLVADRAERLIEQFDLVEAADRPSNTYSGGMRRRLDLAASLIADPEILFLDEPTTGLDPRSRLSMWALIEERVQAGTTVLLTTQYLDEADRLADQIVVIDHGRVIADGTPASLKAEVGGERFEVRVELGDVERVSVLLGEKAGAEASSDAEEGLVSVPLTGGPRQVAELILALDQAGIVVSEVELRKPTLDDVFLSLTGQHAPSDDAAEDGE